MSQEVYKIFEEVEFRARLLDKCWANFHTEISQYLPETYQPEMDELSERLDQALENLVSELRSPTLTLATTGTTSSGKSTLVNLLCGAEIVPVAVSEMSAGVVTIEYSEEKSLVIQETPGAVWECGEWYGIGEEEIYQRLNQTMLSYIDSREQRPNLACPLSVIRYPFRLLKDSQIELPRATKVQIMDLPGLAFVGDEGNANVIRKCREALCLVTYNSAETDQKKVKNLLQEVVDQVKDLGGSPARMLFVLNRIDVFRADKGWPETERRFVDSTISSIKAELTDRLKEYTEEIEDLKVVKLSTWPALLALQIQSADDHYSIAACKKSDNYFNGLIEDVLEDLPRNAQKWSSHDRGRVAAELWQKSYAEEFQQNLIKHITRNFPQLVIPQIIERFNVAAGNAVAEWAVQTTSAILNSSQDRYEKECKKIKEIRETLDDLLRLTTTNLKKPFEKFDRKVKQVLNEESEEEIDLVTYIREIVSELQSEEPYDALNQKLYPLFGWQTEVNRSIQQVLEAVASSLENGVLDLDGANLKRANPLNLNLLERKVRRLIDLGYTASVARDGKTIEAKSDTEKNKLKQLNDELNELAIQLSIVASEVLRQVSKQELERMYQAIVELFNCHSSYIEKEAIEKAPDIAIKFPESQIVKIETQPKMKFNFQAGFIVTKGTWQEKQEAIITIREAHKRNTGGKSGFRWLAGSIKGFADDFVLQRVIRQKKYVDYVPRPSDKAEIPGIEELLEGWIFQAKEAEIEIIKHIAKWLLVEIEHLKKNVDEIQTEILDRYQSRLDKAYQEVTSVYSDEISRWQPMQQKAQNLAEEFYGLEDSWKPDIG